MSNKLCFSGALGPLYMIRNNVLTKYKGNKFSMGGHEIKEKIFKNVEINLQKGDLIYIFTDGYLDQFGGSNEKKFLVKRFKEMLVNISNQSMNEQEKIVISKFKEWKGTYEQIDDVLVIGIKI